jgi:predicted RNase H-like HicB family nuclease
MSTVLYVARVSATPPAGYRAQFPDLPKCEAEGRDLAELLLNARQVLIGRLEAIANEGDEWPRATPIEEVAPETGVMLIPIDVAVDDPPIRVNISLGERLVQRLDAAAEARGMTRSGFIAQAVRVSLGEVGRGDFDAVGRRIQDELSAMGRRINDSIGPESSFSRRMNDLDGYVYDGVKRAADTVSAAMTRRKTAASAKTSDGANGAETRSES